MNYTIATLKEYNMGNGNLELSIDKSGNSYLVCLYNTETKKYTYNVFDSIDDAFKVFSQLSEWIVKSYYTEEYKCEYLRTVIIDLKKYLKKC